MEKTKEQNGITLTSPEPIMDNMSRFNNLYYIPMILGLIIGFSNSKRGLAIWLGISFVLVLIHAGIAAYRTSGINVMEFTLPRKVTNEELIKLTMIPLTQLGMTVEKKTNGTLFIKYKGKKYDVLLKNSENFIVWMDITPSNIGAMFDYRKQVVATGLIAYTIQEELRKNS